MARAPLFAANWKMNKFVKDTEPFVRGLLDVIASEPKKAGRDFQVLVAPSATHLTAMRAAIGAGPILLSAQNCGQGRFGAFTGENSPAVLKEIGCDWVILGHSERRHVYLESDERVQERLKAALEEGLSVILCVGEKLDERKAGKTSDVVRRQMEILKQVPVSDYAKRLVIAYEPVWAIGTGEVATPEQAQEVHAFIRGWMRENLEQGAAENTRILYGGSVKPENASDLMKEDVDGFLVGGASLEVQSFAGIIRNSMNSRG